ncbi:hypothetical protein K8353_39310, partial [Burkholderia contaminans]|nr:hypothetical protein [Burkholderia contaminans]
SAADRFVIKGPGGTITIDASGVTIEGVAIKLKGPVTRSSGAGNGLSMSGTPSPGRLANCSESTR